MSSTIFFFLFIIILAIILFSLNIIFAPHIPYYDKNSAYESGFSSFLYQNRAQFNISFFLTAILFLVFDLEIILVYPYVVSAYNNSVYGLVIVLLFLAILTAGFVFELGKKALIINSRQSNNLHSISISPSSYSASFASPKKPGFKKQNKPKPTKRLFY
jgi:NADH-ubiquinone oxidoreductase chain 3